MWTVIGEERGKLNPSDSYDRALYRVLCDCGAIEIRRQDHVDSNRTKRCKKCSSKEMVKKHGNPPIRWKLVGDLSGTFWSDIKASAKARDLSVLITKEEAWELFEKQNRRCALSGVPIVISPKIVNGNRDHRNTTASLDRIDSSKPYTLENCQWVHKEVNYLKKDLDEADLIKWCDLISFYRGQIHVS